MVHFPGFSEKLRIYHKIVPSKESVEGNAN